jgi:hypothetical protein
VAYSIGFDIFAKDKASATFDKLGKKVGETQGKFSKTNTAIAAGAAVALTSIVAFGTKSVDTFANVGAESLKLQRYMGGTIEDASRLRYAGTQSGLGVDAMATSFGKLSKTLVAGTKDSKSSAEMFKTLGFSAKDSHGKMLPMADLIPKLSDKFAKMPAGTEKTALALKLFGKQGMAMIPFLNKGSAGIKALAAESDKFGTTLNDKDTAAIKENVKQKRLMNAAIEGVQIKLGRVLMPAVVAMSTKLADLAGWFDKNASTAKPLIAILGGLVGVIGTIVAITKVYTAVQTALDVVLAANPIGIVVLAIAALAAGLVYAYKNCETFRNVVDGAFKAIAAAGKWMWNTVLQPVITSMIKGYGMVFRAIGTMLSALGNIPGFGWAKTAGAMMLKAADGADKLAGAIKKIPDKKVIVYTANWSAKTAGIVSAINTANKGHLGAGGDFTRASGGSTKAGRGYLVGEEGPEWWSESRDGVISNAADTARLLASRGGSSGAAGGGGSSTVINLHVNGQVYGTMTELARALLPGLQQLKGSGVNLGLT